MSSFPFKTRVILSIFVLAAFVASNAIGADPKVVRAAHKEQENNVSQEVDDTKSEDFSYSPQWPEPPQTGALLMRLFVGTIVVIGLCVGTLWFGKPWLQKLQVAGAGSRAMHIEGSIAIGNRAMLYLVRVGDTQLVAGADASGLKSLIAIPSSFKEVLDRRVDEVEPDAVAPTQIPGNLDRAPRPTVETAIATPPRFSVGRPFGRSDSKE